MKNIKITQDFSSQTRRAKENEAEHILICEHRIDRAATKYGLKKTSNRLSEKEHKVDALATGAEEGRDKLRKAAGRCK